jgi:hypothetical protein
VQDALDAGQRGRDFGAEKPVGIADDADLHPGTPCEAIFRQGLKPSIPLQSLRHG